MTVYVIMGAACTRLDIPPDVARYIRDRQFIHISDARYETIWLCISPHIHNAVERHNIRQLLKSYLEKTPCKGRYLVLHVKGSTWVFEITSHVRTKEYTELIMSKN
jgi:hypothetical protein